MKDISKELKRIKHQLAHLYSNRGAASTTPFTELTGTDWDGSNKYKTLTSNTALTLTTGSKIAGILHIYQDSTGSRTLSINGVPLSINTTANSITGVGYYVTNGQVNFAVDKTLAAASTTPPNYEAESELFFTAEGITLIAEKDAVDTLVKGLKTDGTWTLLDALWLFFGATHKFNLKNAADLDSAYRLLFTGGWTHDAAGSKGNGTTGYANTFLTPSLTFAADNSHIGAWLAGAGPAGAEILMGANTNTLSTRLGRGGNGGTPALTGEIDAFGATGITTISAGHYIVSRKVSTSIDLFKDGAFVASPVKTSVGRVDKPLFIGASNNWFSGSQVISDFSASTFKLAHAGKGLTNTQATALYNRLSTFLTAISR